MSSLRKSSDTRKNEMHLLHLDFEQHIHFCYDMTPMSNFKISELIE